MPSTYSSNLKIELQATGENSGTWGSITNTNLGTALEQAIVGYGNPDFASDASLTLSYTDSNAAQAARALVLNVTSTGSLTGTRDLVVPTIEKQYIVQNNTSGSQSITVKTSAGTGVTVPNGSKAHLYVDGTNVIFMDDYVDINGGSIDGTPVGANSASTGAFTDLSATSANITTLTGTTATYGTGSFTDLDATSANITTLTGTTATYGTGSFTDLDATSANITTLTGTTATYTTGSFTDLSATSANITTLTGTSATITTILDGAGNVRNIPSVGAAKTAEYTLTVSDIGEFVTIGTSGKVLIPNDVFATGNAISVYNDTTGGVSINISATTGYVVGTDTNRTGVTLATRGIANILFINPSYCILSGNLT